MVYSACILSQTPLQVNPGKAGQAALPAVGICSKSNKYSYFLPPLLLPEQAKMWKITSYSSKITD